LKILITSSRMPFALGMVRQLADAGHEVYAADDYERSPGSHSKYLAGHFVYPSARRETEAFIDELERIIGEAGIDAVVPAFEEAFYIATQRERLAERAAIFVASFASLARLHDKAAFQRLVRGLGLPIPETVVAASDAELAEAIGRFDRYFARAVFSRGGVDLLTNTGPLAGHLDPGEVHPTEQIPWLVQPFVEGETACTYSTVHDGTVSSHLMYRIPRQWHHSTGIQFESVDATESLRLIEPLVKELGYTGQISFDFLVTDDGLSFVECNPRATDGALLLAPDQIARGLLDPDADTFLLPAGETKQLELAVVGDAFSDHFKRAPQTIRDLARLRDAGDGWHDPLPTLYSAFSLAHFAGVSHREHAQMQDAMDADMAWDGEPIRGMSNADAKLLAELTATS
jgi:glutathione synthase/RimK-type ligase-like ATP-grasp enzyme